MKIALITFSRTKNYGGTLQAYALNKYLSTLGHDVYFIDYITERGNIYSPKVFVERATSHSRVWGMNCFTRFLWKTLYFKNIRNDYLKFFAFIEKECKFSDRYFSNEDLIKNPPQAELFMVGSDQVWNSDYAPGKQLELPFYLPFTTGNKMSYGSSFGNASLPDAQKNAVRALLQSFDALSVREETGKQILEELGLESTIVSDPTLLFDGEFWSKKCTAQRLGYPYILLYQVKFDVNVYRTAKAFSEKLGYKLIILSMNREDKRKYGQSIVMTPSVEEWISYIKNAKLVYTDSFHATVFSILLHTAFVVNSASRKNMSSRISNLLRIVGLAELEMTDYNVEDGLRKVSQKIEWDKVDSKAEEFRTISQEWLIKSIARLERQIKND